MASNYTYYDTEEEDLDVDDVEVNKDEEEFDESAPEPGTYSLSTRCPDGKMCYGETACKVGWNNTYTCICWHASVPPRKGWVCDRIVVTGIPTPLSPFNNGNSNSEFHNQEHHRHHGRIPVIIGYHPRDIQDLNLTRTLQELGNHSLHGQQRFGPSPGYLGVDNQMIIPLVSLGVALTLLFAFVLCFLKRKSLVSSFNRKGSRGKIDNLSIDQPLSHLGNPSLLPHNRFVSNPTYETTNGSSLIPLLSIPIVKQSEILSMEQIGEGCFGKVFKGTMNGEIVAVKVIKKEHSEETLREMETMTTFHHPNILELLGIAQNTESDIPWLIFELMEFGDLISVLRKIRNQNKTIVQEQKSTPGYDQLPLTQPQITKDSLFDMAYQISEGMKYLSSQHFVHRDLAARNCLLGANGVVKISDFGLSRDVYTCDYYKVSGSRSLPVRWMAPECVLYGRFTLESDVWAFGVLLWEMYTWGVQPYYGHSNEEVVQLILDGMLLSQPSDCPHTICELMAGSWKTNPKDRFTFVDITERFVRTIHRRTCVVEMEQSTVDDNYEKPKSIQPTEYMEVV